MRHLVLVVVLASIPAAWGEVYVENDRMYTGADGTLHVVGDVWNNFDMTLSQIRLTVTIYDTYGEVIGNGEGWSLVNTLMPNMKAPFDVMIHDAIPGQPDSYTIDTEYKVRPPKDQVIDVTSAILERSSQGDLFITGTVANNGDTTANMVFVVGTIYGRDGNVATVSRTYAEPDYLRAGHEGTFVLPLPEKDQTTYVSQYSIVAESDEYAAVPEFPLGPLGIMTVSAALYIVFSRRSTLLQRYV